ncbi:hypothetical protein M8J75_004902 [Diaphorina citri]|nr:hypothetical protein M8J75_004902 [Diaphorina citri]
MPVCRYFQEGYCRNGNRCGFDHVKYDSGYQSGYRDSASTNRVWVNPGSKYAQDNYSNHSYNSNYSGRSYNSNYSNSYNNQSGQQRSNQNYKENSAPQSSSNFSFTKTLSSVQSSSGDGPSSLQQRINPTTTSSASTSSFSFVKALQEKNKNTPLSSTDSSLYSKIEDLAEDQKIQFKAAEFTCGKVPVLPPSIDLC